MISAAGLTPPRLDFLVQVAHGRRLDAVERGHAHQHLVALALSEQLQHLGRMVALQVHQDGGDDLRVLVAHQLGHGRRIHPLQAFDAADIVALQDAVEQQVGLVLAERALEHRAHVFVVVVDQHAAVTRHLAELVQYLVELVVADALHARDGLAHALHLLRRQVLEDLAGVFLAQRHQQDGGVLDALVVHVGLCLGLPFRTPWRPCRRRPIL